MHKQVILALLVSLALGSSDLPRTAEQITAATIDEAAGGLELEISECKNIIFSFIGDDSGDAGNFEDADVLEKWRSRFGWETKCLIVVPGGGTPCPERFAENSCLEREGGTGLVTFAGILKLIETSATKLENIIVHIHAHGGEQVVSMDADKYHHEGKILSRQMLDQLLSNLYVARRATLQGIWMLVHACYSSTMFSQLSHYDSEGRLVRGARFISPKPKVVPTSTEVQYLCCCCDVEEGRPVPRSSISWFKFVDPSTKSCFSSNHESACGDPFKILQVVDANTPSMSCGVNNQAWQQCAQLRDAAVGKRNMLDTVLPSFKLTFNANNAAWKTAPLWLGLASAAEDVCTGTFLGAMEPVLNPEKGGISGLTYRDLIESAQATLTGSNPRAELRVDFIDTAIHRSRYGVPRRPAQTISFGNVGDGFEYVAKFWCGAAPKSCRSEDLPRAIRLADEEPIRHNAKKELRRTRSLFY